MFTRDQEILIKNAVDHVEGFLIVNENTTNEWRSSFSSPSHQSDIVSLLKKNRILYSIELAKYYYDDQTARTIDKEFEMLLKGLNYIPGFIFSKEASFFDFINRTGNLENEKGQLTKSHPWMNLFVPQLRISDFNNGVLVTIVPTLNETSSQFLFYPINGYKWEIRMSVAYPREDVFYLFALQHSSRPDNYQIYDKFNADILEFCKKAGIEVKQYVPNYESKQDWIKHFGSRWDIFQDKKESFDPKMILSTGQRIFDFELDSINYMNGVVEGKYY